MEREVTGATSSGTVGVLDPTGFPVTSGAIQSVLNGPQNAFFSHINTTTVTGQNVQGSYSTYFGGNGVDSGSSIAVDPSLNTYFAGQTTSTNLQTQGALQSTLNGTNSDAFAVKLLPASALCINCVMPVLSPAGLVSAGNQVTITYTLINQGPDLATNITVSGIVTAGATFTSATAGSGTCSAPTGNTVVCTIPTLQAGSTSSVGFVVTPNKAGSYSATATVTASNSTNTSNTATAQFTATDFTLAVKPSSQTVVAGNTATYSVSVTPGQAFGANVTLTCGSLPVGTSCGFMPATLSFTGPGSLSSILNLTTTVRPVTTISSTKRRGPILCAMADRAWHGSSWLGEEQTWTQAGARGPCAVDDIRAFFPATGLQQHEAAAHCKRNASGYLSSYGYGDVGYVYVQCGD